MKFLVSIPLALLLAITSCAPSPQVVATAMAQTQAALPTNTPLPSPTVTHTLTPEPPTSTSTVTPTSTPDIRVINADPKDILCTKLDLPADGGYVVPSHHGILRESNKLAPVNDAEEYVHRTGRIDGWRAYFTKDGNDPYEFSTVYISCGVEVFQTAEGAQLAVREYNDAELSPRFARYFEDSGQPGVGDASFWIVSTGAGRQWTFVDFSYRNYRVVVTSQNRGLDLDEILYVAQQILNKLEHAPLIAP